MDKIDTDILIIGGGLTGASLLLALANLPYKSLLVDAQPLATRQRADFDARSLALSPASVRILSMLGIWSLLEPQASPVNHIHVSQQQRFAATRIQADGNEKLGYVVEMTAINAALQQRLPAESLLAPAKLIALDKAAGIATVDQGGTTVQIQASLIVGADGSESMLRQLMAIPVKRQSFNQLALVGNVAVNCDHQGQAFERFTADGLIALLPLSDQRMALIWAGAPQRIADLQNQSDQDFLKSLQKAMGYRPGRFTRIGRRMTYPLQQVTSQTAIDWPVVLVGNAAQTLHPVAGQGFNLGLRDVAMLAQQIAAQGLSPAMLKAYQQARQPDQQAILRFTGGLIQLFNANLPGLGLARNLGLLLMDNNQWLKGWLAHYARGYGGIVPDLVCGIPLQDKVMEVNYAD